jgi:hypothetical protein
VVQEGLAEAELNRQAEHASDGAGVVDDDGNPTVGGPAGAGDYRPLPQPDVEGSWVREEAREEGRDALYVAAIAVVVLCNGQCVG